MYCNPVFIILIKYHRVKETQQNSRRKYIINSSSFHSLNDFLIEYTLLLVKNYMKRCDPTSGILHYFGLICAMDDDCERTIET